MSDWPKYNPERHSPTNDRDTAWCRRCGDDNGASCHVDFPCRCCETARADEAEAEVEALRASLQDWSAMAKAWAAGEYEAGER